MGDCLQNSFGSNATGPPSEGQIDVLTDLHTAEKLPNLSYTKFEPKMTCLIVGSLPIPAIVQEVGHTRATCFLIPDLEHNFGPRPEERRGGGRGGTQNLEKTCKTVYMSISNKP